MSIEFIPPDPPQPNRETLTRLRLSEIKAFLESDRKQFPEFSGTKNQQSSKRDHFKKQAEIFFIPNTGPLKGVLCTTRQKMEMRGKKSSPATSMFQSKALL